jgi:hypothetical protein
VAAQDLVNNIWWPLATTVTAMFGLIYSVSVLGDALRDAWDPRLDGLPLRHNFVQVRFDQFVRQAPG